MTITKTLGGDRVGSGNRMKQRLHNFYRSNQNLSCTRTSSMAPGVLYPIYTNVGLMGDSWDINAKAFMRTIPTQGPMFGAFKLQVDFYKADLRLFQAILHNNTTEIGLEMEKVLLPKMKLSVVPKFIKSVVDDEGNITMPKWKQQISKSALLYYLGLAGVGKNDTPNTEISRKFNATPLLAYYSIFKEYYSNKQEDNAYVITSGNTETLITSNIQSIYVCNENNMGSNCTKISEEWHTQPNLNPFWKITYQYEKYVIINGTNLLLNNEPNIRLSFHQNISTNNNISLYLSLVYKSNEQIVYRMMSDFSAVDQGKLHIRNNSGIQLSEEKEIRLESFPLTNIDNMRKKLLTYWDLGTEIVLDEQEELPYQVNFTQTQTGDEAGELNARNPMQGLVVKCYQSDLFNNWLNTEYVDKINEMTSISTATGSFTIDALNFAKKVWELYNRIAISGATYDDWQEATYGMKAWGKNEKPQYCGGFSSEVIFDEVVSTSATTKDPLGTLGGRGALKGDRGGKLNIKCGEACIIMAIASLTPRINQTQGNAWYLTELDSMDDLHKPSLDNIGFQDLMVEQMAWWDTEVDTVGTLYRNSAGKQPCWINYQTDVDKSYGDFAEEEGKGYMILQRLYETTDDGNVADVTTYIDPRKYNYAFAYDELNAQNFWGFFTFNIHCRRLMSANQIPNF